MTEDRYLAAIERVLERDNLFIEQHLALIAAARAVVEHLYARAYDDILISPGRIEAGDALIALSVALAAAEGTASTTNQDQGADQS